MSDHPPPISSILRPSHSFERLHLSGAASFSRADTVFSIETLARSARPGTEAITCPVLSAIANMVIQTKRVWSSSRQIVESVRDENSFVYTEANTIPQLIGLSRVKSVLPCAIVVTAPSYAPHAIVEGNPPVRRLPFLLPLLPDGVRP